MNFIEGLSFLLRPLLYPFSLLYGLIIWVRNRFYDQNIFSSIEFDLPVICVGNLNTGGTGKTPMVEYLIRMLQYEYRVATMSRGYKRKTKGFKIADASTNAFEIGDEPMQYFRKFSDVTVTVSEDRLTGIPQLLRTKPHTEVILLDDAFQHRSVRAGLNILLTDYHHPYFKDYILPFGSLREPRIAASRAEVIIVSKCPEDLSQASKTDMINRIKPLPHQKVFFAGIKYQQPVSFWDFSAQELQQDMDIILVCGIANPTTLVSYLEKKVNSVHLLQYPDHHYFSTKDLEEIKTAFQNHPSQKKAILITEKDSTRLALHSKKIQEWNFPIWIIPIQIYIMDDALAFQQLIVNYIDKTLQEKNQYA